MKNPANWDRSDLHSHLQSALDLELWTIPLYLNSLYSIKDLSEIKREDFPPSAKLIFSVVVQEMLHVELVCNLSNALGYSPKFKMPQYDPKIGIPFIQPDPEMLPENIRDYQVRFNPLGAEALKLFCAIELPHPKRIADWENEDRYSSIADLYEALRIGIAALWDSCYVGHENNKRQKDNFKEYHRQKGHGFSIGIDSLDEALNAIEAIVEQGEGADSKHVPAEFRPPQYHRSSQSDIAWYKDDLSHYQKFRILLHSYDKLPETYPVNPSKDSLAKNETMKRAFYDVWHLMELSFNSEGNDMDGQFWRQMPVIADALTEVWKSGMCPEL